MVDDRAPEEIQHYEALLAREPASRAFAQLAAAYARQGRLAEAVAACEAGLQRYPAYVGARMILARALAERGDAARAEAEFRRILEQTPDDIPAHRALGDLLRGQGRAAEALGAYEAVLDLTPFDRDVADLMEGLRVPEEPAAAPAPKPEPEPLAPEVPFFDLTEAAAAAPLPLGRPVKDSGVELPEPERAPLATETLAELYVQQGFVEDARDIYRELVRVHPSRADLRGKLAALEGPAAAVPAPAPPHEPAAAVAAGVPLRDDDPMAVLEAWLAAARGLRAERRAR